MTKQVLNVAIVLAAFAAMCGTAYARGDVVPDATSTSALCLLAAAGLCVVRKFIR